MSRTKLGLVPGGGGARGLADMGVLRSFEEEKIPIAFIGGSSMGALIGGMYAQNQDELLQLQADLVIRPDIADIHWSKFSRVEELIQVGLDETRKVIPQVKKLFKKWWLF